MTECGRCGDCCEEIYVSPSPEKLAEGSGSYWAWFYDKPDPRTDEGWAQWVAWWPDEDWEAKVDEVARADGCDGRAYQCRDWEDARWFRQLVYLDSDGHSETRQHHYSCPLFDSEARLCTDHANRPPICRDFPWYGKPGGRELGGVSKRCTFWADVAPEKRPADWAPVNFVAGPRGQADRSSMPVACPPSALGG